MKLKVLMIQRTGQVDWRVAGDNHCGPKGERREPFGEMPVRYTVVVECGPELDKRGFLFDQAGAESWIRDMAAKEDWSSCETIAEKVGLMLDKKIRAEHPKVDILNIRVTISPSPFAAAVTAVLLPDDD